MLFLFMPIFLLFTTSGTVSNVTSSYVVLERSSKRILYGENIDKQMLVASTAKILTAVTAIEYYDLEEKITIARADTLEVGSKVYLKENEVLRRKDLIYALMLRSANDAASALSQNNSDEFIYRMNELAKKIGMKNSVFTNASGLDEREYNLSTAYDMALLSAYAASLDVFVEIASSHKYLCESSLTKYLWVNKHRLVNSIDSFLWGKTGYTKKSRRILVSDYVKEEMDIIVVTINMGDDWNFHKRMITKIEDYTFETIYKKGIYDTKLDVTYYLYIPKDIVLPLREEEYEQTTIKFVLYPNYAKLEVYMKRTFICGYTIEVYDKNTLDIDYILELY